MGYERFSLQSLLKLLRAFFIIHSCHSLIMVSALIHGSSPIDSEIWRFGRVIKSIKCYERVHNISAQEQRHSSDLEYMQGKMRGRACKTHVGVLVPRAIYVKDCQNVCQMIRYDSDYLNESRQKTNVITNLLASLFIVICWRIADQISTLYSWQVPGWNFYPLKKPFFLNLFSHVFTS